MIAHLPRVRDFFKSSWFVFVLVMDSGVNRFTNIVEIFKKSMVIYNISI